MSATLNDSTIISKKYESHYATSGLDNEYEGAIIVPTVEQRADAALGHYEKRWTSFTLTCRQHCPTLKPQSSGAFQNGTEFTDGSNVILDEAVAYRHANHSETIEGYGCSSTIKKNGCLFRSSHFE